MENPIKINHPCSETYHGSYEPSQKKKSKKNRMGPDPEPSYTLELKNPYVSFPFITKQKEKYLLICDEHECPE